MINHWFRGKLGKMAALGYALGMAALIASLIAGVFVTSGSAGPVLQVSCQGEVGGSGEGWIKVEALSGFTFDFEAEPGYLIDEICYKNGQNEAFVTVNPPSATYHLDISGQQNELSHVAYHQILAPTATSTNPPPTETSSNTPTEIPGSATSTPTNTPVSPTSTPSLTPTYTATNTPTHAATDTPTGAPINTLTPSVTNTLEPGVTPTETNTPTNTPTPTDTSTATNTPTNTPEAPNLADPKEYSLLADNDGNGFASVGDVLLYTITIGNTGGSDAEGVVFTDSPDPNTTVVAGSVTTTQGTVTIGNTAGDTSIAVDIGSIEVGDTITITFQVTINLGLPSTVTEVENQGLVSGDNIDPSLTDDPNTQPPDDPTVTELIFPTAAPSPTAGGPGPTNTPATAGTPSVLIPVTGVEFPGEIAGPSAAAVLQNIGLGLLGLSLAVHGISLGRREAD